ncbi:MAG TPA: DUF1553 domain-containing protein [Thermoanaerobaculia bacterium]|jgi:hypothetical protein
MKRAALIAVLLACALAAPARQRAVRSASNAIDTHVFTTLARNGITPAPPSSDSEFLRRVTLDLTGAIPAASDAQVFLADASPDKRARKIDALLQSEAFNDRWTMWFGDLVQNVQAAQNANEYYLGRNVYYRWIRTSIASHKPYDAMVRELLAGEGLSFESGVANYVVRQLQRNGPPQDTYDNLAAHSVEKFLGIPALCISCHDGAGHLELVNWYLRGKRREDFWKMAAFFAQTSVRAEKVDDSFRITVGSNPNGAYRLNTTDGNKTPRSGQTAVAPAFLTTGEQPKPGEPLRVAYARMLTADRQFARAAVNHLWKEMFGRGLVDPVNAFDLAKLDTQPSHPELLEALADEFIAKNYSLRELLRTIALSRAYQLSSTYEGPHPDESYFARRQPRRLSSEMLFDAVGVATNSRPQFLVPGIGFVPKAMQLPDPLEGRRAPAGMVMDTFGRGDRDDVPRSNDSSIAQALALLNDPVLVNRVRRAPGSTVQTVLASTSDPNAIADKLYLAALSRYPSAGEKRIAVAYLNGGPLAERTEDLLYVLINSLEFLFS